MGEILKGAMLVELSPVRLELADLRIEGGRIVERAARIDPGPGDRVTDLSGRLLMPGLVVAHTHLYCSLALGMPPPAHEPKSFREILDQVWWKLDRALDPTTVILSASAGAAEALLHGITTIVDLHSSPSFIEGSLAAVHRGVSAVGARSVLSYEVTDRNGKEAAKAALRESESFLKNGQNARCRSLVGGHSSFTLDNDTLEAMVGIAREHQVGLHLHVAESPEDDRDARKRFGMGVMDRLEAAGALSSRTLLANCTHLAWEELSKAQQHGCWMIHNARSNMSHAVGYAPAGKFGSRRALGTDGVDNDLFTEGQFALFKAREAGYGVDLAQWLAGGHRIASEIFGLPIGPLEAGAAADLVVLDYASATPLTAETLSAHLCRSLGSSSVDSVMVDGAWRVWARQLLSIDAPALFARTAEAAKSLWSRAREL